VIRVGWLDLLELETARKRRELASEETSQTGGLAERYLPVNTSFGASAGDDQCRGGGQDQSGASTHV
jgi:hypothetical protein